MLQNSYLRLGTVALLILCLSSPALALSQFTPIDVEKAQIVLPSRSKADEVDNGKRVTAR